MCRARDSRVPFCLGLLSALLLVASCGGADVEPAAVEPSGTDVVLETVYAPLEGVDYEAADRGDMSAEEFNELARTCVTGNAYQDRVQRIIRHFFTGAPAHAIAVAKCESGTAGTRAYNAAGPYLGLFQMWKRHCDNPRYAGACSQCAWGQVKAAWRLRMDAGWGQWPNCP
jgi:hypothetical protein